MHDINTFFNRIIVLSPLHNHARREFIQDHFHQRGITNWEFFDAIDYKILTPEARLFLEKSGLLLTEGYPWLPLTDTQIVACLSFMKLLLHAKSRGYRNILHVEDDSFFLENYEQIFNRAVSHLPADWDAIHFHSHVPVASGIHNDIYRKKINDYIYLGFSEGGGASCVGLTQRAMDIIFTRVFPLDSGIDGVSNTPSGNWYEGHENYKAYISVEFLVEPNHDLPNTHAQASIDKIDRRKNTSEHLVPPHMKTDKTEQS